MSARTVPSHFWGALGVGAAALLWATDSLFRVPALASLDPVFIVLCEHLIGVIFLSPWPILPSLGGLFRMRISQVFGLLTVGAGGSALATVLFTMSFRDIHPSVAILLQKLQPIFVLILASIFLKEKLHARFLKWAALALLAGFILSFPDLDFSFLRGETNSQNRGVFFAVGAALLWATSTVVGKKLLTGISPLQLTGWRYLFGFLTLVIYISQSQIAWSWGVLYEDRIALRSVLLMSLVSGLFAMFLYYQGLVRTRATTATLMELLFPVAAVLLNAWVLDRPLELMQVSAGLVLLIAVTRISFLRLPSVQE